MKFSNYVEFARSMAKLGFFLTAFCSTLFLILTVFFVRDKMGSYRYLLMMLPVIGFIFAFCEFMTDPFFHSYNGGFAFFRLSSFENVSPFLNLCALGCYVALYGCTISVLTLQFVYRYWIVFRPRFIRVFFDGKRFISAIFVVSLSCIYWFSTALIFHQLDDYSSEYLGKDMLDKYGLTISKQPVFVIVAYHKNGDLRLKNFVGLMVMSSLLVSQYGIMIYCAIVMSMKMQEKLSVLSEKLQKVHRQFYHVLILQITTPTLTLFFPVFALFFVPYLNIKISFPTGTILCTFALYPALDLLIMVYIASYYNQALKDLLRSFWRIFIRRNQTARVDTSIRLETISSRISSTTM